MPVLSPEMEAVLRKSMQDHYESEFKRVLRQQVIELAKKNATALAEAMCKPLQVDNYLQLMALINPDKE
jgi:hypothetical protein